MSDLDRIDGLFAGMLDEREKNWRRARCGSACAAPAPPWLP
jgi:hypothetical protein